MLTSVYGDMFMSKAQAITNAVNCEGIMGGGLAYAFRSRFPSMCKDYAEYCAAGKLRPGGIHVWQEPSGLFILNFPTKDELRYPSRLEYVASGLFGLNNVFKEKGIRSVAIPALGCGLGMLDWSVVKEMVQKHHDEFWQDISVELYEPLY
jgi:O-acetyl-ADP-ribose deacetylase (regulator of RNase III)